MKIDRSNYEIWLIDYLDGNLSDLQVEELNVFLSGNPDLREEFNELTSFSLKPREKVFPHKNNLKKTSADISLSQFEYLCVASLENDLSASQQTELNEIVNRYPEKKRILELIQKTRLIPSGISYKHKNQLHKSSAIQIFMRFAVMGLSSAATVALLITTYLLISRNQPDKSRDGMLSVSTQKIVIDSRDKKHSFSTEPTVNKITADRIAVPEQKMKSLAAEAQKKITVFSKSDSEVINISYTLIRDTASREKEITRIPVFAQIDLRTGIISNTLIVSNSTFVIPSYDEERSNIGRFIAKNFREIFLKEKSSKDTPLKGYEIAEAGVAGLNRLLGWQMALEKTNDENGELKSVYFSSKILKFNAPVKKNGPQP